MDKTELFECVQCEGFFVTDENGVNNHIDDGGINYDADLDHVPFGEYAEI